MRCRASGERLPLKRLANLSGCHFSDSCEIGQADHGDVIHTVCTIRKADLKSDAGVTWSLTASSRKSAATDCTIPDHQHAFPPFLCSRRHGPFEDGGHTTSTSRIDGRRSLHLRAADILVYVHCTRQHTSADTSSRHPYPSSPHLWFSTKIASSVSAEECDSNTLLSQCVSFQWQRRR